MLSEIEKVRQVPGEDFRRWFTDENMDLIVWYDDSSSGRITGFQLCFDKRYVQRCLTWQNRPGESGSILSADGRYSPKRVLRIFDAASDTLPDELVSLIKDVLSANNREDVR